MPDDKEYKSHTPKKDYVIYGPKKDYVRHSRTVNPALTSDLQMRALKAVKKKRKRKPGVTVQRIQETRGE